MARRQVLIHDRDHRTMFASRTGRADGGRQAMGLYTRRPQQAHHDLTVDVAIIDHHRDNAGFSLRHNVPFAAVGHPPGISSPPLPA